MTYEKQTIGPHTLYRGDCLEILPTLGKVDAVVTDPPYGIDIGGAGTIGGAGMVRPKEYGKSEWDKHPMSKAVFAAILTATDQWIVWGGNHLAGIMGPSRGFLFWDKRCQNGWDDNFSEAEVAWTNTVDRAKGLRHLWAGALRASEQGKNVRQHPTQKPIVLMEWCIGFTKGTAIIDPFMGSGTTIVAAHNLGRVGIGIELEPKYFDIACKRVEQAVAQQSLFTEKPAKPIQEGLLP